MSARSEGYAAGLRAAAEAAERLRSAWQRDANATIGDVIRDLAIDDLVAAIRAIPTEEEANAE